MKNIAVALAASVLLFLQVHPAGAQPGMARIPKFFGGFTARVGVWSEYEMVEKDSGRTTVMRFSIVGREGDSHWYEVHITNGASRNIIKMFITGNPENTDNIQRLIVKSGDRPAMEMPKDFLVMGRQMASHMFEKRSGVASAAEDFSVEELGTREVTVPAGTFTVQTRKVISADGRELGVFDFSDTVYPIGVVQSVSDGTAMKLVAFGDGAVTAVTEEPLPIPVPPGMPGTGGPPPGMMPPGMAPPAGR